MRVAAPKSYRPDIDGLRAIAVLAVVFYHGSPRLFPGGLNGVDVFFVISGFLITNIILTGAKSGTFSVLQFYAKRVRRIFPALCIVLATTLLLGYMLLLKDEYASVAIHVLAGTTFYSNFLLLSESGYFDASSSLKPLLHLWSLAVEEQFYLFWPAILLIAFRFGAVRLTIVVLTVASLILYLQLRPNYPTASFYLIPTRLWELGAGGMAAAYCQPMAVSGPSGSLRRWMLWVLPAAGIGMVFMLFLIRDAYNPTGILTLLPVLGTIGIIAAGQHSWISRLLSIRPLVAIGRISYPLYLWHWPLLSFARILYDGPVPMVVTAALIAAAFVLATVTYIAVEIPLRSAPLGKSVVVLLFGSAGIAAISLAVALSGGIESAPGNNLKAQNHGDIGHVEIYEYMSRNFFPCTPPQIYQAAEKTGAFVRCFQSRIDAPVDFAIVGDSHAEHLFIGVAEALPLRNIAYYIRGSLPSVDNEVFDLIFSEVEGSKDIRDVVLAGYWRGRGGGGYDEAMQKTIKRLAASGKNIIVTDDVPVFPFGPNRCKFNRAGVSDACVSPSPEILGLAAQASAPLRAAAEAYPNVRVISTMQALCDKSLCKMSKDGNLLYRDEHHLNIEGSRLVGRYLVEAMGRKSSKE